MFTSLSDPVPSSEVTQLKCSSSDVFSCTECMHFRMARAECRYVERLQEEMDLACSCANWGGPTFLLTSAYTVAVSIGLDWGWDAMTAANRTRYQDCIITNGIDQHQWQKYSEDFGEFTNRMIVAPAG